MLYATERWRKGVMRYFGDSGCASCSELIRTHAKSYTSRMNFKLADAPLKGNCAGGYRIRKGQGQLHATYWSGDQ